MIFTVTTGSVNPDNEWKILTRGLSIKGKFNSSFQFESQEELIDWIKNIYP